MKNGLTYTFKRLLKKLKEKFIVNNFLCKIFSHKYTSYGTSETMGSYKTYHLVQCKRCKDSKRSRDYDYRTGYFR